jgi:uncharacterized metal-binding protein
MIVPQCAICVEKKCCIENLVDARLPSFCPMKCKQDIIEKAFEKYREPDNNLLYVNSTIVEQQAYANIRGRIIAVRPRVLEIIKFCERMKWKKIGIAFCNGLSDEAKRLTEILTNAGFEVYSICCKCGNVDKTKWGIEGKHKISNLEGNPNSFEAGCNPIVQADVLNSEVTDLNIIVGLCIGHDLQFIKYSQAPVTTLIVKDRVTGHNPFTSLFNSYHHPTYWKEDLNET